jgi:hypothetical protein
MFPPFLFDFFLKLIKVVLWERDCEFHMLRAAYKESGQLYVRMILEISCEINMYAFRLVAQNLFGMICHITCLKYLQFKQITVVNPC